MVQENNPKEVQKLNEDFFKAIREGDDKTVKDMLNYTDFDVKNYKDSEGRNAFHILMIGVGEGTVKKDQATTLTNLLLERLGNKVNELDDQGDAPIHTLVDQHDLKEKDMDKGYKKGELDEVANTKVAVIKLLKDSEIAKMEIKNRDGKDSVEIVTENIVTYNPRNKEVYNHIAHEHVAVGKKILGTLLHFQDSAISEIIEAAIQIRWPATKVQNKENKLNNKRNRIKSHGRG